ncbi:MAG: beta-galactosidase [Polyangiaceae bacterium]|nr:beta-galactosidase [Polyangiaceae bacterium]
MARDFEVMSAAGVKVFRFAFGWDSIEARPGEFDFRLWDEVVAASLRHDITLIPYVCYTPRWLSADPDDFWRRPPSDPIAELRR